ncbi:MAG: hypothetical protein ACTSQE_07785 [Candidatus Heimdallarchaeaceae archaeon]
MVNKSSNPIKDFKDLFLPIKDQFEQLPILLLGLIDYSDNLVEENKKLQQSLEEKDAELEKIRKEVEGSTAKLEELTNKNKEYEEKLARVEESLSRFREMYDELATERVRDMDIEELLAIYSVLFENVFAANPHTKILLLLQGTDKEFWTRDEIVKTTGISPAAVLKALYDLRNNGIVMMDEDNQTVTLIQKLV